MEDKKQGYKVKEYSGPVKRYCQTLDLREDNPELIAEYRKTHSKGGVWPETLAAIREVGILENYNQLRQSLEDRGSLFQSSSDAEVLAHLIKKQGVDRSLPRIHALMLCRSKQLVKAPPPII